MNEDRASTEGVSEKNNAVSTSSLRTNIELF